MPNPRQNNFDFLRLFAAALVIYGHAYSLTGFPPPGFAGNGVHTIGVKVFFTISGFLIAQSWQRDPSLVRFMLRRSVRIFPALIVVVLLSIFVLGPICTRLSPDEYFRPATFYYIYNIALYINYILPGVFEENIYPSAVNGSLWSLPAEFFMYVITPPLIAVVSMCANRSALFLLLGGIFSVTSLYLLKVVPRQGQFVVYGTDVWSWLAVAPYFVGGMVYAVCRCERLLNIYVAFVAFFLVGAFQTNALAKEAALILVLPYVCLSFGLGSAPALTALTRGGDLSYGLFLYGFPVQQTLVYAFGPAMGPWGNFIAALLICLPLAFLSWHLIEKPALRLKPSGKPKTVDETPMRTSAAHSLAGVKGLFSHSANRRLD